MEEKYEGSIHVKQEGYYNNLKLSHLQTVMVQNLDDYNRLHKESEKDPRDTTPRWIIDTNWVHCVYLDDKGLVPIEKDKELPESPVICISVTPPQKQQYK